MKTLIGVSFLARSIYMQQRHSEHENEHLFGADVEWGDVLVQMLYNKVDKIKIVTHNNLSKHSDELLRQVKFIAETK